MTWRCVFVVLLAALALAWPADTLHAHDGGLGLARLTTNGAPDATFGRGGLVGQRSPNGGLVPDGMVLQADGKIVLAGTASDLATASVGFGVARYNADGSRDSSFGQAGQSLTRVGAATSNAHAIALQPDGRIVLAGAAYVTSDGPAGFGLLRVAPDGGPDRTFGDGGTVVSPVGPNGAEARAIAVQPDGRTVVGGTAFANAATDDLFALARYGPDGQLDAAFGKGGIVLTQFASGGAAALSGLVVQPDAKIVAAGSTGGRRGALALARYTPTGALDTAFGKAGIVVTRLENSSRIYAMGIDQQGRVVLAGAYGEGLDTRFLAARYTSDGGLDASFGGTGDVTFSAGSASSGAHALLLQPDGRMVMAGAAYTPGTVVPSPDITTPVNGGFAVARLQPDGSPDFTFGKGGLTVLTVGDAGSAPVGLAADEAGRIVVGGPVYFLAATASSGPPLPVIAVALVLAIALSTVVLVRFRTVRIARATGRSLRGR